MDEILERLKRRKIVQWALAYLAGAFALIQMVDFVGQRFGWPEAVGRGLVIAGAIGLAITLVLAWYHGERGAQRVSGGELVILALLLLIGGGLFWIVGRTPRVTAPSLTQASKSDPVSPAASIDAKSIAVLPLANTSGDPANEYFSDGLSEELISVLARIPDLKIIGRNSSFHFKNTRDDSRTIGERLGVANLLEGSVRKQGERVRIAVDLITAADGRQLWGESYDRELKDIFAVQSEIATAVVEQLKVKLLVGGLAANAPASPTPNLAAYQALLHGQFAIRNFNIDDHRKAIAFFQEATRLDPGYALAYAQLSRALRALSGAFLTTQHDIDDSYARARDAVDTALKLAPELSEAHGALGMLLLTPNLDLRGAEIELRRAVALAPRDALAIHNLSYLLAAEGRLAEAEAMTRQAIALDPEWVPPQTNLARIQLGLGRFDDAEATLRKVIAIQPGVSHVYSYLTLIDLRRNDATAALRDAKLEPEGFWRDFALALALQAKDDRAAADSALQELIERNRYGGPFQIAIVYAVRKEPDRVFEWLDNSYTARDSGLTQLLVMPFLLDFRDDPRFVALAAKIGIDPSLLDRPK